MAFMRKLANKLEELSKKNEEVSNFLESIPEWQEFSVNVLQVINGIESKPLASDPRQKKSIDDDEYFDLLYKFKDVHRSGFHNKQKNKDVENEVNQEDNDDNDGNNED
jgi:hypothetical protein